MYREANQVHFGEPIVSLLKRFEQPSLRKVGQASGIWKLARTTKVM